MNHTEMKNLSLATLVALCLLPACSQNEHIPADATTEVTLYAITTPAATRTHINEQYETVWDATDCIGVLASVENDIRIARFDLKSEPNSSHGIFTGILMEGESLSGYAIYPYKNDLSLTDNTLILDLPTTCDYESQRVAPMLAQPNGQDNNYAFKHLCGILKFTIRNVPATATTFKLTASLPISGSCQIADISSASPVLSPLSTDDASCSICVHLPQADENRDLTFYLPVPPATYTAMTISFINADGHNLMTASSTATNVVGRAVLTVMPVMVYTEVDSDIQNDNINDDGNEDYTSEEGTWD